MFQENTSYQQKPLFSDLDNLSEKVQYVGRVQWKAGGLTHGLARSESGALREEDRHCASYQTSQPGKLNRVDAHDTGCCTQEPNDTERVTFGSVVGEGRATAPPTITWVAYKFKKEVEDLSE